MSENAPRKTTLTIRQDGVGQPSVMLGGLELRSLLRAQGGLSIEYAPAFEDAGPSVPCVTMRFTPGSLDFDFDLILLTSLIEAARAAEVADDE